MSLSSIRVSLLTVPVLWLSVDVDSQLLQLYLVQSFCAQSRDVSMCTSSYVWKSDMWFPGTEPTWSDLDASTFPVEAARSPAISPKPQLYILP